MSIGQYLIGVPAFLFVVTIVVFFHEGDFYVREYCPQDGKLLLKANTSSDTIVIEAERWECWGVVMLTLNPLLQPAQKTGRYGRVCAC